MSRSQRVYCDELVCSSNATISAGSLNVGGGITVGGALTHSGITESSVSAVATLTSVVNGTPGNLAVFPTINIPANSSIHELFIMTSGVVNLDNATGEHMDVLIAINYGTATTPDLTATALHTGVDATDAAFSTTLPIKLITAGAAAPANSACSNAGNVGGTNSTFVGTNLLLTTVAADTMTVTLSGGGNNLDDSGSGIDVAADASMTLVAVFRTYSV